MKILWVHAHPEPRSLTSSLRDEGLDAAIEAGHEVKVSDLYAMAWNATLDTTDFGDLPDRPTEISRASEAAHKAGTLTSDIQAEQDKLLWCDTVVLQFPLWWYSTPAILKGWIDRVFTKGFAYGIPDPANPRRTYRYGDGPLSGRRAQVFVTIGSPARAMGPRGVNGQLDQVLFPLLHGTLWYVGMDVLPPVAIHDADHITTAGYDDAVRRVRRRVQGLASVEPLPYRHQNGGDYDAHLVLRDDIAPGRSGLGVHLEAPVANTTSTFLPSDQSQP